MGVPAAVMGFQYLVAPPILEVAPGSAVITPIPSPGVMFGGAGAYSGPLTMTFPPGTLACPTWTASGTNIASAVFSITPAGIVGTMVDGKPCIGVGDMSTPVPVTGTVTVPLSPPVPTPIPTTVTIIDAGQVGVMCA